MVTKIRPSELRHEQRSAIHIVVCTWDKCRPSRHWIADEEKELPVQNPLTNFWRESANCGPLRAKRLAGSRVVLWRVANGTFRQILLGLPSPAFNIDLIARVNWPIVICEGTA